MAFFLIKLRDADTLKLSKKEINSYYFFPNPKSSSISRITWDTIILEGVWKRENTKDDKKEKENKFEIERERDIRW